MKSTVLNWTSKEVASWLGTIGFNNYVEKFKDEEITGEVLVKLDHETLMDLNIESLGKRIQLLKAIYELKIRYQIPIYNMDYAPPSSMEIVNYEDEMFGKYNILDHGVVLALKERDSIIKHLVNELSRLNSELLKLLEHQPNDP